MQIQVYGVIFNVVNEKTGEKNGKKWNSFEVIVETDKVDDVIELVSVGVFNKNRADFKIGSKVCFKATLFSRKFSDSEKYYTVLSSKDFVIDNGVGKANDQRRYVESNTRAAEAKAEKKQSIENDINKHREEEYKREQQQGGVDKNKLPF